MFLFSWEREEVVEEAFDVSHSTLNYESGVFHTTTTDDSLPINTKGSTDGRYQHGLQWLPRSWTPTWPASAGLIMDIYVASGSIMEFRYQRGLRWQTRPQTSTFLPVIVWTANISMISGGSNRPRPPTWLPVDSLLME